MTEAGAAVLRFDVANRSTTVAYAVKEVAHVIAWFLAVIEFVDGILEPLRTVASLWAIFRSGIVTPVVLANLVGYTQFFSWLSS